MKAKQWQQEIIHLILKNTGNKDLNCIQKLASHFQQPWLQYILTGVWSKFHMTLGVRY